MMISSFLQKLNHPLFQQYQIDVKMLRLDLLDPVVSGNKWFKLKYYLEECKEHGKKGILSFGGPWSNHIVATAYACKKEKIPSVGIIRGEKPPILSPAIADAISYGMDLRFVSRAHYNDLANGKIRLSEEFDSYQIVPEGGKGSLGVRGAAEIMDYLKQQPFEEIFIAVGTGTTMRGLLESPGRGRINGVLALKIPDRENNEFESMMRASGREYLLHYDYHFGAYGRKNEILISFMNDFHRQTAVPLDYVYTAKMVYGFCELVKKGKFPSGTSICLIHSGGLQGNRSVPKGSLNY